MRYPELLWNLCLYGIRVPSLCQCVYISSAIGQGSDMSNETAEEPLPLTDFGEKQKTPCRQWKIATHSVSSYTQRHTEKGIAEQFKILYNAIWVQGNLLRGRCTRLRRPWGGRNSLRLPMGFLFLP